MNSKQHYKLDFGKQIINMTFWTTFDPPYQWVYGTEDNYVNGHFQADVIFRGIKISAYGNSQTMALQGLTTQITLIKAIGLPERKIKIKKEVKRRYE